MKELVLLHVVDSRLLRGGGSGRSKKDVPTTKDISKKLEAAGQKVLTDCAHRMEVVLSQATTRPFTALKTAKVKSHPVDSIITYAEKHRPDVVVVGSRGMNNLPSYLFPSYWAWMDPTHQRMRQTG